MEKIQSVMEVFFFDDLVLLFSFQKEYSFFIRFALKSEKSLLFPLLHGFKRHVSRYLKPFLRG